MATMGSAVSRDQRREAQRLRNVTIYESRFKLEWMDDPWDDVSAAGDWLLDVEAQVGPDIIHLNGYAHASLPWRAPVMVIGHSCVLSWWRAVKGEDAPANWDRYRRAVTRGLRSADVVVAPSQSMMTALERHYAPLPPARVIHNGRDGSHYHVGEKHAYIVSAGRVWDEAKNVAALDAVAGDLPWPVLVAGERTTSAGHNLVARNVTALGHLGAEQLAAHLAHASIYALPARYEPFGLSILEAALSGCALVLGDIDSFRELWGDAAIFVPPNDADALRRALAMLIDNHVVRQMLGQRARERAARYTPERMVDAYLASYRTLLTSSISTQDAHSAGVHT
jgi:glycogen synthase